MSYTPKSAVTKFNPDGNTRQHDRIRSLENKFEFSFEPWLHGFAMTLAEPVKAFAHFVQPKGYDVDWNPQTRVMNFRGDLAKWGMENVKRWLGKEVFDHFGKIRFAVNGVAVTEKQVKPAKNEAPVNMPYMD